MEKLWKDANLLEKRRNSDYSKYIDMYHSKDPLYGFAMISACRGLPLKDDNDHVRNYQQYELDRNQKKNNIRSNCLKDQLQNNNLGLMEVIGHYSEEDAGDVEETSYLVYTTSDNFSKLETLVTFLGKKHHQDSVLFISPDKKIYLIDYIWSKNGDRCVGSHRSNFGRVKFNTNNVDRIFSQFGSKLTGHTFKVIETINCSAPTNSYLRSVRLSSHLYPKYERFCEKDYLKKVDEAFEEFEEST